MNGAAADDDGAEGRRVHLVQGEYRVSADPALMLTTLVGSCVAACLYDARARVGGMNHFLLPGTDAEPFAVHFMELLVNGLLRGGARRDRLCAKLFGGAQAMGGLADVGARNAGFARGFLAHEGIRVVGASLGGFAGRRVQFWPATGRARQSLLSPAHVPHPSPIAPPPGAGAVEFF